MRMRHLHNLPCNYHKVIFEFTNEDLECAGFEMVGLAHSKLKILKVLKRLAKIDRKRCKRLVKLFKRNRRPTP